MGLLRQYRQQDERDTLGFFDSLIWLGCLWLDRSGLITLERRGVQLRGGFDNGRG